MSNVEILGRSNLQTIKSRQMEWNQRINEKINKTKKIDKKTDDLIDLIYERDKPENH